jgi:phytoene synthase
MPVTPESHSARYFALLYSPGPQRLALDALFGIEREISESLRPGLDHHVAHSRLQWWREECERAAAGRPVHPLTRALVDAVTALSPSTSATTSPATPPSAPLSQLGSLCGLVDVAVWDLAGATFETRRELTAYCERWSAAMIGPFAPPQVADAPATPGRTVRETPDTRLANWSTLGAAMREIEMLSHLAREAHYGRLRVPLDELESAKADPGVLAKPPWPASVVELLRARHKSLRDEITRALSDVDRAQQPGLRGLLVWAALARRASQRTEDALPDRLRLGRFDEVADAWLAWRVARRATIGRFRLN